MHNLIIAGAGSMGRELLQWVKDINKVEKKWNIKGFINDIPDSLDGYECDYSIIGTIEDYIPQENDRFTCAIADPEGKALVVNKLKKRGAIFDSVIHPSAHISDFVSVGEGLIMYPNALITVNAKIGDFVTILSSNIGHDVQVGNFSTISSYCDITGKVCLGEKVFLGSHVTVVPKRKIGNSAYVGAGSVVISNIKAGYRVIGNPARKMDF